MWLSDGIAATVAAPTRALEPKPEPEFRSTSLTTARSSDERADDFVLRSDLLRWVALTVYGTSY